MHKSRVNYNSASTALNGRLQLHKRFLSTIQVVTFLRWFPFKLFYCLGLTLDSMLICQLKQLNIEYINYKLARGKGEDERRENRWTSCNKTLERFS